MTEATVEPWLADSVRRQDRDRFIAAMLCPPPRRAAVLAVLAFNGEIARIRERVAEPMMGHIRLQWWRDALARAAVDEDAEAAPLLRVLAGLRLWPQLRPLLAQLIDARQKDLDDPPFSGAAAAEAYAAATTAPLAGAMAVAGGLPDLAEAPGVRAAARGHGLVGILRATPGLIAARRNPWEADLSDTAARAALARDAADRAEAAIAAAAAARLPREAFFLAAPAALAHRHLRLLRRNGYDILDARFSAPSRVSLGFLWLCARKRL
ncbi:squalene/phytoene synthase family protein [Oleispirillum naphthae]|uniref:squalene/phytoene synthase family protein n=1 Tax=Oleispirillum naphthae TaxID=2838853 RepID=UPI00308225DC